MGVSEKMGNSKDIEDKFKKEVSKEIANLKEFLIQQGKEIVKIKQENKTIRNIGNDIPSIAGLSPELKAILDKQQSSLDKQKENTTKLSKLCLGTLTELEKIEKIQQEELVKSKDDDKLKRLSDENKRLIHLVSQLDQQMKNKNGIVGNKYDFEQIISRIVKLEEKTMDLSKSQKEVKEEIKNLNNSIETLSIDLREKKNQIEYLERNQIKKTEEIQIEQNKFEERISTNGKKQDDLRDFLQREIEEQKYTTKSIIESVRLNESSNKNLKSEIDNMKNDLRFARQNWAENYDNLTKQITDSQERISKLEKKNLGKMESEIASLKNDVDKNKKFFEEELKVFFDDYKNITSKKEDSNCLSSEEKNKIFNTLVERIEKLENRKEDVEKTLFKFEEVEYNYDDLVVKLDKIETKNAFMGKSIDDLQENYQDQRNKLCKLEENRKTNNSEGREKSCKELEILRKKMFDLQTGIEHKDRTITEIQNKILENDNLTSKLQFSIKQLENSTKIEEIKDQIKINERSIEELKEKSKESFNRIAVTNQTQLNLVKTDVEKNKDFSENLKSYLTSIETKFEMFDERCIELQKETTNLKLECEAKLQGNVLKIVLFFNKYYS